MVSNNIRELWKRLLSLVSVALQIFCGLPYVKIVSLRNKAVSLNILWVILRDWLGYKQWAWQVALLIWGNHESKAIWLRNSKFCYGHFGAPRISAPLSIHGVDWGTCPSAPPGQAATGFNIARTELYLIMISVCFTRRWWNAGHTNIAWYSSSSTLHRVHFRSSRGILLYLPSSTCSLWFESLHLVITWRCESFI